MTHALSSLILSVLVTGGGTDTTIAVKQGARLQVECFAGSIEVGTWSRPAVRVVADHSRRVRVEIERRDATVSVNAVSRHGVPVGVDYRFTVPSWMPLELSGMATDITVTGVKGPIKASSVRGDVVVEGGTQISAQSVEGDVKVRRARGRVAVSSMNQNVEIEDCSCDEISAEAINGNVFILGPGDSKSVSASSVNGHLFYDGTFHSGGSYSFSTHGGDIVVGIPQNPDVAVSVATFGGDFSSVVPINLQSTRRGKRLNFVLGSGNAQLEMESFQGAIRLEHTGEAMKKRLERYRMGMFSAEKALTRVKAPKAPKAPAAPVATPQPPEDRD